MAYSILGWGEPLVEVRTGHLPEAMVLDTPDKPGNLDCGVHNLIDKGSIGFSGDILNATNAARHILANEGSHNQTALVTAVGDDNCVCSEQFIEWLDQHGIGSKSVQRVSHGHMGAYFEGYRDELGSFPYARSGAAFESLTERQITNAAGRHELDAVGLMVTGITHARTKRRCSVVDVLERAKLQGAVTFYAVNFRMSLWGTRDDESKTNANGGLRAIAPHIDFCVLGKEEAEIVLEEEIQNTPRSKRDAAKSVLDLGVRRGVALTGYPEAYMALRSNGGARCIEHSASENELTGANTTGAGDNFTGAFAAFYLISGDIPLSFNAGCQIAEWSTTVEGGIYHPRPAHIQAILSRLH